MDQNPGMQPIELLRFNEWEINFSPFLHKNFTGARRREQGLRRSVHRNQVNILTPEDTSGMELLQHHTMSDLVAYVDGGSLGNPGPSGIGVIIDGSADGTIRIAKWIGHQDNNVAEYVALLEALQWALRLNADALHVFSDSEVVVRQIKGEYSCRSPRLSYSLNWICRKLARSLDFSIAHVRREDNAEANDLATSAARNAEAPAAEAPANVDSQEHELASMGNLHVRP